MWCTSSQSFFIWFMIYQKFPWLSSLIGISITILEFIGEIPPNQYYMNVVWTIFSWFTNSHVKTIWNIPKVTLLQSSSCWNEFILLTTVVSTLKPIGIVEHYMHLVCECDTYQSWVILLVSHIISTSKFTNTPKPLFSILKWFPSGKVDGHFGYYLFQLNLHEQGK